jgi:hypothetical protein
MKALLEKGHIQERRPTNEDGGHVYHNIIEKVKTRGDSLASDTLRYSYWKDKSCLFT